jgi:hypothetical protein
MVCFQVGCVMLFLIGPDIIKVFKVEQDPNHMIVSKNKLFHMGLLEFCVNKKVKQFIHFMG